MILDLHKHLVSFLSRLNVFFILFRIIVLMKRGLSLFDDLRQRPFLEEYVAIKLLGTHVGSMRKLTGGYLDLRQVYAEGGSPLPSPTHAAAVEGEDDQPPYYGSGGGDVPKTTNSGRDSSIGEKEAEGYSSGLTRRLRMLGGAVAHSNTNATPSGGGQGNANNNGNGRSSVVNALLQPFFGGTAGSTNTATQHMAAPPSAVLRSSSVPNATPPLTAGRGTPLPRPSSNGSNANNGMPLRSNSSASAASSSAFMSFPPTPCPPLRSNNSNSAPHISLSLQTTHALPFDAAESISDTVTLYRTGDDRNGDTILVWLAMPWEEEKAMLNRRSEGGNAASSPSFIKKVWDGMRGLGGSGGGGGAGDASQFKRHVNSNNSAHRRPSAQHFTTSFACRLASTIGCHCAVVRVNHLRGTLPITTAANTVAEEIVDALSTIEHRCIVIGGCEVAGTVALHALRSAAFKDKPPVAMILFDPFVGWRTPATATSAQTQQEQKLSSPSSSKKGSSLSAPLPSPTTAAPSFAYDFGAGSEVLDIRADPSLSVGLEETTFGALIQRFGMDVDRGCEGRIREWFPSWLGTSTTATTTHPPTTLQAAAVLPAAEVSFSPPRRVVPKGATMPASPPKQLYAIVKPGFAPPPTSITSPLTTSAPCDQTAAGFGAAAGSANGEEDSVRHQLFDPQDHGVSSSSSLPCPVLICSDTASIWAHQLRDFQQCLTARGVDIALEEFTSSTAAVASTLGSPQYDPNMSFSSDYHHHNHEFVVEETRQLLLGFMEDCELWLDEMLAVGRFACGSSVFSHQQHQHPQQHHRPASSMFNRTVSNASNGLVGLNRWSNRKRFRSLAFSGGGGFAGAGHSRSDTPASTVLLGRSASNESLFDAYSFRHHHHQRQRSNSQQHTFGSSHSVSHSYPHHSQQHPIRVRPLRAAGLGGNNNNRSNSPNTTITTNNNTTNNNGIGGSDVVSPSRTLHIVSSNADLASSEAGAAAPTPLSPPSSTSHQHGGNTSNNCYRSTIAPGSGQGGQGLPPQHPTTFAAMSIRNHNANAHNVSSSSMGSRIAFDSTDSMGLASGGIGGNVSPGATPHNQTPILSAQLALSGASFSTPERQQHNTATLYHALGGGGGGGQASLGTSVAAFVAGSTSAPLSPASALTATPPSEGKQARRLPALAERERRLAALRALEAEAVWGAHADEDATTQQQLQGGGIASTQVSGYGGGGRPRRMSGIYTSKGGGGAAIGCEGNTTAAAAGHNEDDARDLPSPITPPSSVMGLDDASLLLRNPQRPTVGCEGGGGGGGAAGGVGSFPENCAAAGGGGGALHRTASNTSLPRRGLRRGSTPTGLDEEGGGSAASTPRPAAVMVMRPLRTPRVSTTRRPVGTDFATLLNNAELAAMGHAPQQQQQSLGIGYEVVRASSGQQFHPTATAAASLSSPPASLSPISASTSFSTTMGFQVSTLQVSK